MGLKGGSDQKPAVFLALPVHELEQDTGWLSRILKDGITEDRNEITVIAFRDPNIAATKRKKKYYFYCNTEVMKIDFL